MTLTVALQLHSVREAMRFEPWRTLDEVAAAGYRHVELSAHDAASPQTCYELPVAEIARHCEAAGLTIIGGQVRNLSEDNADAVINLYRDLGSAHITVPIDYFPTIAAIETKAHLYNELGVAANKAHLRLYYAHHYHEFQVVGGETILDGLLRRTDPALVNLSFSPYWLMRGLVDPLPTFHRYADRIGLIEQADFPLREIRKLDMWSFGDHHPIARNIRFDVPLSGGEIENIHPVQCNLFTEIGDGILKLQDVVDAANATGRVRFVVLRQDFTRYATEYASIRRSHENYERIRDVQWA
jgi:sugar phosphate isomerase/epimerase